MIQQIRAQPRRDQLLILVFALLIVYVVSTLVIVITAIPEYYQRLKPRQFSRLNSVRRPR